MPRSHRIDPRRVAHARRLRREAPFPERILWSRLRRGQLNGFRFRQQHQIGPYIADFYGAPASLVIELDGASHDDRAAYDAERTRFVESRGIRAIRFSDDEVLRDVDGVTYRIACEIGLRP